MTSFLPGTIYSDFLLKAIRNHVVLGNILRVHWNPEQDVQRQYVNMYMRRRQSLASIGSEAAEDKEGEESAASLTNAIAQVKEFALIFKALNL